MAAMKSLKFEPFFVKRRDCIDEHRLVEMISFAGVAKQVRIWHTPLLGSICLRF